MNFSGKSQNILESLTFDVGLVQTQYWYLKPLSDSSDHSIKPGYFIMNASLCIYNDFFSSITHDKSVPSMWVPFHTIGSKNQM